MTSWLSTLRARLRRSRPGEDLRAELEMHLELAVQEGMDAGLSAAEAQRRARLALGSSQAVVENMADFELRNTAASILRDFLHGFRRLRQSPVLSITAILTLAIGIGSNTAIFTLLYGVLLRPLSVPNAHELVTPRVVVPAIEPQEAFLPFRMMRYLQEHSRSYSGFSIWYSNLVALAEPDGTASFHEVAIVSGNAFEVLGAVPYMGRHFTSADDAPNRPGGGFPVVIGYRMWRNHFGGDRNILGRRLRLTGQPAVVVGIAPPDFYGIRPGVDIPIYLPLAFLKATGGPDLNSPNSYSSAPVIARLRPDATIESANAELAAAKDTYLREFVPPSFLKSSQSKGISFVVRSAQTGISGFFGFSYSAPIFLMQALAGIVLILCCVNVSGLMLSRVHERSHEFAVRTAIGAARWRLIRQYLTESFVIAVAGAALGALFAWHGIDLLLPYFRHPDSFTSLVVYPDRTVFFVTGALAILCTLFFGILPAWKSGNAHPGALLKSRDSSTRHRGLGRFFVPVQVSLSLVLVTSAGLLSQSLIRIRTEHRGFDLDRVTIQTPPLHLLRLPAAARVDQYQRMVDRIQQAPAISSAAVTWYTPMTGSQANSYFEAVGEHNAGSDAVPLAFNDVGPGYFRTMATRILAGREFERGERTPDVCVANESAARRLFGRQNAMGRYVRTADSQRFKVPRTCRIVGIAEDAKFASLREQPPPTLYFPISAETVGTAGNLVFLINSPTKAQSAKAYGAALAEFAPSIPLVLFATLREQMDAAIGRELAITLLSGFFALVALILSALGLYGMLSSSVAQRTPEIGVRVALGALRANVIWMILASALRHVGAGILVGALGVYFAVRLIQNMLYGVTAFDPLTLLAATGTLVLVALVAALLPALRAASVDPIRALRAE